MFEPARKRRDGTEKVESIAIEGSVVWTVIGLSLRQALAAIVVEQRHRWFKVQVPDGAAWLQSSDGDEYFALQQLLVKRPAYLTEAWDGTLAEFPGGAGASAAYSQPLRQYTPVRFVESRDVRGALWLKIEVMSHTIYEFDEPPKVVATGWVPAHDPSGKVVVWFYSRD